MYTKLKLEDPSVLLGPLNYFGNYSNGNLATDRRIKTISRKRICIIGLGGVGSTVAYFMSQMITSSLFLLVDNDNIEVKNVGRGLINQSMEVGKPKVEEILPFLSPSNIYFATNEAIENLGYLSTFYFDVVVDCRDNIEPNDFLQESNFGLYIKAGTNENQAFVGYTKDYRNFVEKVWGDPTREAYTNIYPFTFPFVAFKVCEIVYNHFVSQSDRIKTKLVVTNYDSKKAR